MVVYSGSNTDYRSSEPLKTLVMLCYVMLCYVMLCNRRRLHVVGAVARHGQRRSLPQKYQEPLEKNRV